MSHYFIGEPNAMELAWAAGFFDGEGTCVAYVGKRQRDQQLRPRMSITQHGMADLPEVLARFHRAVGQLGKIAGSYDVGYENSRWLTRWSWSTSKNAEVGAVFDLIDPYLSAIKRAQIQRALDQFAASRLMVRKYTVQPLTLDFTRSNQS